MSRRTHRKSRNGCVECKKRHVKCDETVPICVNCRTTERLCSFANHSPADKPAPVYPSPATTASTDSPTHLQKQPIPEGQQYIVNLEHMDLLCHFYGQIIKDFNPNPDSAQNTFDLFAQHMYSGSYILYQALAISALHKSLLSTAQQDYFREYATGFQNQALLIFNNSVTDINQRNYTPAFIFSSLIGLHVLCETLRFRPDGLDAFLDRFTHFLTLHQGVKIVAHTSWEMLRQSDQLKPYLEVPERTTKAAEAEESARPECAPLYDMLEHSDLSQQSLAAYQLTVKHLQWAFDMNRCAQSLSESKQMLLAWTVLVPQKYTNLLMQRRAEALVILAYYGALLLRHQDFWVVGDGGECLIASIKNMLGRYWERWLAWPIMEVDRIAISRDARNSTPHETIRR